MEDPSPEPGPRFATALASVLASTRSGGRSAWGRLRPLAGRARTQAPTLRGQVVGAALMLTPVVAHTLPLTGATHTAVLVVAVLLGSLGALIVFGGLLVRAVLEPSQLKSAARSRPGVRPVVAAESSVDDALLALPHARVTWTALALFAVLLAAGALWCLARLLRGDGGDRLAEFLLLGLPAAALGCAAWRGRVMLTQHPGAGPAVEDGDTTPPEPAGLP